MNIGDRALHWVAWIVAINLIVYHGFLMFFSWMPTTFWITYHSVEAIKPEFAVHEKLKFRSHTDLHRDVILTFNDILFCREQAYGDFQRYSSQDTKRLHSAVNGQEYDRYTVWPYSPGVAYPTECYLESNINLHLPLHITRSIRYDGYMNGKTFQIVEE